MGHQDYLCLCGCLVRQRLGNVNYQLARSSAVFIMGFEHLSTASGHVHRVEAENVSAIDLNVKAKPVSAEQTPGGIKRHRNCDRALEVSTGGPNQTFAYIFRPGHSAH